MYRFEARWQARELALCAFFNRAAARAPVRRAFQIVSRLGDGIFWYGMIAALPIIYGPGAWRASLNMAVTGLVCLLVYKTLKGATTRPRPFVVNEAIRMGVPPLDAYSFPSGHTLHAVSFTVTVSAYYPELAALTLPFAVLVALSRLVLGLHYPTDVLAGAVLGLLLARVLLFV